jgi:hypothetical protein
MARVHRLSRTRHPEPRALGDGLTLASARYFSSPHKLGIFWLHTPMRGCLLKRSPLVENPPINERAIMRLLTFDKYVQT